MAEKPSSRHSKEKESRIPTFKTIEEEAEFWDTHSSEDYADELETVTDVKFIRPRQKTSLQAEPLPFGMAPATPHKRFVDVRSQKYGSLKFHFLLPGDMDFIEKLVQHNPDARDFTCQFLQHLMIEPVQSLEQVQSWDDTLLLRVAEEWVKEAQHCKHHPAEQVTSFEAFKQSVLGHQSETIQTILETMQAVLSSAIESIVGSFISADLIPPVVNAIQQAPTDQELHRRLQGVPIPVEAMRKLEVLRWLQHQDKIAS